MLLTHFISLEANNAPTVTNSGLSPTTKTDVSVVTNTYRCGRTVRPFPSINVLYARESSHPTPAAVRGSSVAGTGRSRLTHPDSTN